MTTFAFKLNVTLDDRTGRPRVAYLGVRTGVVAETREIAAGTVFADYDDGGRLLGIEFLAPCAVEVLD